MWFQNITVALKFLPLLFVAVAGWFFVSSGRDLVVAGASVLFSMWATFAAGYQAVNQALVLVLAGIVLYAFISARRRVKEAPSWLSMSSQR